MGQSAPQIAEAPKGDSEPELDDLFQIMIQEGGSDLLLKTGSCPAIRVDGLIRFISDQRTSPIGGSTTCCRTAASPSFPRRAIQS